jgi:hypothetical protein
LASSWFVYSIYAAFFLRRSRQIFHAHTWMCVIFFVGATPIAMQAVPNIILSGRGRALARERKYKKIFVCKQFS